MLMAGLSIDMGPVKEYIDKITDYFSNLSTLELAGWIMICAGILLLVTGIIIR